MSHITQLALSLQNLECVKSAVTRMDGAVLNGYKTRQLAGKSRKVLELQLPSFKLPIYIDINTGEVFNDNYNGHWGDLGVYNKFLQLYASEVAKDFAINNNYSYEEEELAGGKIRCTLSAIESIKDSIASEGYNIG